MPGTNVLTAPLETADVRHRLGAERRRILEERSRLRLAASAEAKSETLDAAAELAAREFAGRLEAQIASRLREIEAAEERLRDGTYGQCAFCKEPVPFWRLNAIPWAEFCLRCQELMEA